MEDFKQYLSDDADDQERTAAEQVRRGLAGLRLEAKVNAVAAERKILLRQKFWQRVIFAVVLALVAGAILWFYLTGENVPPKNPETPPKEQSETKKNAPIASNQSLREPPYPAPNVRGENTENKAWKALLDQIWYTDYPPAGVVLNGTFAQADQLLKTRDFSGAYVRLQRLERTLPANDTLRLLKGYCLLEMGEGTDALTYFEKLEERQPGWDMPLQWYRGLALLLMGEQQKALMAFKKMAAITGHPYHQQSQRAIQLLE